MLKFLWIYALLLSTLYADEVRPLYLQLQEQQEAHFQVILKVPAKGDRRLRLNVNLPSHCEAQREKNSYFMRGAYVEQWTVICPKGIRGERISIEGIEAMSSDLLLRLEFRDGSTHSSLLTPTQSAYTVAKVSSTWQIMQTYTSLGIIHILMGFDHLLFVFALLLIVGTMHKLLWTITAFTLAHSITMAGATLGFIHIPQQPVEAIIALSILFLTMEIIHKKQGKIGFTSRYPWLIAFIFGLLHGFGFAGALAEIGLPQQAITLALIFFNIGVEVGQLMFVATVVLVGQVLQRVKYPNVLQRVETVFVYGIGGLSSFWFFERLSTF